MTSKEKKSKKRSRNRWPGLVVGLGLVATGSFFVRHFGVEGMMSKLEWLKVHEVVVQAESPLTSERVLRWLPPLKGRNILLVDASSLIRNLEGRPWVRGVSLKKSYPDRVFISVLSKTARAVGLWHGKAYFMDDEGKLIEKVEPSLYGSHDLPIVEWNGHEEDVRWKIPEVFRLLDAIRGGLGHSVEISEVELKSYPSIRLFLSTIRMEILLSIENWQSELPELVTLVQNPPAEVGPIHRINLTIPKKAVVSASLSN